MTVASHLITTIIVLILRIKSLMSVWLFKRLADFLVLDHYSCVSGVGNVYANGQDGLAMRYTYPSIQLL